MSGKLSSELPLKVGGKCEYASTAMCLQNAVFTSNYQGQESIKIFPGSFPKHVDQIPTEEAASQCGHSAAQQL